MPEGHREDLRRAYNGNVDERSERQLPDWRVAARAGFLEKLQSIGACTLLEVGAGVGRDAAFFVRHGLSVQCVDLSSDMVAACRDKGLEARIMDVSHLDYPTATFDAVYSVNCLLHLEKREFPGALDEISRVLRPGGLFYYGSWGGFDHEGIYEDDHLEPPRFFSFYDDDGLCREVERVFDTVTFESTPRNPNDPRFKFQALLLRRPALSPRQAEGGYIGTQGISGNI